MERAREALRGPVQGILVNNSRLAAVASCDCGSEAQDAAAVLGIPGETCVGEFGSPKLLQRHRLVGRLVARQGSFPFQRCQPRL
jgi:hypothetical protein